MGLKDTFKKQGGKTLITQYCRSGALFTAAGEFLLLGKSRTALEILRLAAQLKARKKLFRKYGKRLKGFESCYDEKAPHNLSNKVWVCWFQGMENAPEIVRKCYKSLCDNLTDREIVLITADNLSDYADFPDFILKKWKKGIITNTHMTDLLRLELLIKYGGTWIDSTVLCSGPRADIPDFFFDSELFMFQTLKPGRDGHATFISSWFMSAKTNNKVLSAVRFLCYEYWKEHNGIIDYYMLHHFISGVLERYPDEWNAIIPRDNATPHILILRLFEEYNADIWSEVKRLTPFHKLTYKFDSEKTEIKGTYYDVLLR